MSTSYRQGRHARGDTVSVKVRFALMAQIDPLSRAKAMTREAYVDMAISAQLHRDKVEDWNNQYIAACKRAEDMRLPTPIREHFYATNGWIIHED